MPAASQWLQDTNLQNGFEDLLGRIPWQPKRQKPIPDDPWESPPERTRANGGGIYFYVEEGRGELTVVNSTLSGNSAGGPGGYGGGIYASRFSGTATVTSDTTDPTSANNTATTTISTKGK